MRLTIRCRKSIALNRKYCIMFRLTPFLFPIAALSSLQSNELLTEVQGRAIVAAETEEKTKPGRVLIANTKGIVLVSSDKLLLHAPELGNVQGLRIIDIDLPGPAKKLQEQLEPLYFQKQLTQSSIINIRDAIAKFYQDYSHPFVLIEIPPQELSSGVLQLVVIEARVNSVSVEGNCTWSHSLCSKRAIDLEPGDHIDNQLMTRDLNFYNRNPFRNVSAIYEPGEVEGTTDVIFLVQDRLPFQVYAGVDNTGLDPTGKVMEYAGFRWGNFAGMEHIFNYQYTTSEFKRMQAHTVQYLAPLSWKHVLNIYGGYANIKPKTTFPMQSVSGFSGQASLRYTIPLLPYSTLRHEVSCGFDFKRTNNDLFFTSDTGLAPFHQPVNLTQLVVGYYGTYKQPKYAIDYSITFFGSPVEWIADQSNKDYNGLRPGAKNTWIYGFATIDYRLLLPKEFIFVTSAKGQVSSTTLLPSEEFGLGGYTTVRGYDERIVNQDDAFLLNNELHTPTWRVFTKKNADLVDAMHMLVFLDFSYGVDITPVPGQKKSQWLGGVGPGIRYFLGNNLSCRLDWGFKLHKGPEIGSHFGKIHFGVIGSY